MTPDDALAEALELAVEEPTGLFELVWRLQSLEVPEADRRPLAEGAARALLASGWAVLVRRRGAAGSLVPVPPADADRALGAAASWEEPADAKAEQILLDVTPAGVQAFHGR